MKDGNGTRGHMVPLNQDAFQDFCTVIGAIFVFLSVWYCALKAGLWAWDNLIKPPAVELAHRIVAAYKGE